MKQRTTMNLHNGMCDRLFEFREIPCLILFEGEIAGTVVLKQPRNMAMS